MSEVKITERRLKELERAAAKLAALEAGGVDNWEWYSESLKEYRKEEQVDELLDQYTDEILQICSEEGDVEYPAGRECGHSILLGDAERPVRNMLRKFIVEIKELLEEE